MDMVEVLLKVLMVYGLSMLKFILGPIGGKEEGLHLLTSMIVSVAGMMTMVVVFTYFGHYIKDKFLGRFFKRKKKKVENPQKPGFFKKHGLTGIAFVTPVLLSPIGGTLLAVGSSTDHQKIIRYMFISASVWSVIVTLVVYYELDNIVSFFHRIHPF